MNKHPRDTYITVYGRKPVLEVLENEAIAVDKVLLTKNSKGDFLETLEKLCQQRGVELLRVSPEQVARISKNPKQDQGVAADVEVPQMDSASRYFGLAAPQGPSSWLAVDGVTTPANLGLIIRSATALGMGLILPLRGNAKISPLVIKASAGTIFKSHLLKCDRLKEALSLAKQQNYHIFGLAGQEGKDIYTSEFPEKSIFVLGNETLGVNDQHRQWIDSWLTIPMMAQVESLNVACAATIVAAEFLRKKRLTK